MPMTGIMLLNMYSAYSKSGKELMCCREASTGEKQVKTRAKKGGEQIGKKPMKSEGLGKQTYFCVSAGLW